MTLVVDASVVVAALVDAGPEGRWADDLLARGHLAAPHHMPIEVASVLRRADLAGDISGDTATLAHADLLALRVELFPYDVVANRTWELGRNVSTYDGCYVALAELLGADLATLDGRLSRASGPRCTFLVPDRP